MKQGQPKVPTIPKFLSELATTHYQQHNNSKALRVGMDAYVHSASFAQELNEAFKNAAKDMDFDVANGESEDVAALNGDGTYGANGSLEKGASEGKKEVPVVGLIDTLDGKPNLVDSIWANRPPLPKNPFRVQVSPT